MNVLFYLNHLLKRLGIIIGSMIWLVLVTLLGLVFVEDAEAKVTAAMGAKVYKVLEETQKHIDAENYDKAMGKLIPLKSSEKLSNYERAQVFNLVGYIHYLKNDYRSAAKAYERVLKLPELPPALRQSSLKTLSQLSLINENYSRAISAANELLDMLDKPDSNTLMVLGQAYFQLEKYKKAKGPVKQAIGISKKAGHIPKENWLQLLNGIYHNLSEYQSMIGVLNELIRYYPKKQYLQTLAGVYSELGQTRKQLSISEALYEGGHMLRSSEVRNLATLYLLHGVPYKAAKLLVNEIESGKLNAEEKILKLLSQAWVQAGEDAKAIKPLEEVARQTRDAEIYRRLGFAQFNLGLWKESEKSLKTALKIGGLKDSGGAWLMLGMSRYRNKSYDDAIKAFSNAAKHKKHRNSAQQWIAFIEIENERRKELEDYNQFGNS